jgi:integrase
MASLHRHQRSPFWYCAYRLADGRRSFKSTECIDRKEAKKVCEALAHAEEIAGRGDATRDRLVALFNETLERLGYEKIASTTVQEWFDRWLLTQTGAVSSGTLTKYSQIARDFLASLGPRAKARVESITDSDVTRFRDQLLAQGLSPSTVNMTMTVLKQAFKQASDQGLITRNPVAPIRSQRGAKAERGTFSAEQVARLVQAAEGDWKGMILAGYYTGVRVTDLSRLTWANVDLSEKFILFTQQKTGKKIKIPIHPALETHLLILPSTDSPKAPLFPTLHGKAAGGSTGLSKGFRGVMTKAGILSGLIRERKGDIGRNLSALSFHSLRHSFNQELLKAGVPQEKRMLLTGHSSAKMNAGYSHDDLKGLYAQVAKVPSLPKVEGGRKS